MSRNIARYVRQLREQVARLEVPEAVEEQFGRYAKDPVGFCRDVLGVSSATRRSARVGSAHPLVQHPTPKPPQLDLRSH